MSGGVTQVVEIGAFGVVLLDENGERHFTLDDCAHLGVLQGRVAGVVHEVELHLEAGHRVVGVEEVLAQHPLEDIEAAVHLLAVARPVGPGELLCVDILPHAVTLG